MSPYAWRLILLLLLAIFIVLCSKQREWNIQNPILFRDTKAVSRSSTRSPFITDFDYNWTILLAVNEGFRDFFSNWWWHYKKLGIRVPIIIIAEDDVSFTKLSTEFKAQGNNTNNSVSVERSTVVSIPEASTHNSVDYKKIVSARATHILKHLQAGRNVLYSDIDTVWMKNPFPYFHGEYDMWIEQENNMTYCTGFMAIKSQARTIKLMQDWEQALNKKLQLNQGVFNRLLKASNVKFKPLIEDVFPHGLTFNKYDTHNRSKVVVMHNTFVYGYKNKLERFKKLNLWFQTL